MKPGEVHRDPQSQFIRQFQLFVRQKLVNPALGDVSRDGEQPVRLESDEALFAHIALDVLHATRRRHQSIHARLRVLSDLLDAPAIVSRHVDALDRRSQHEKMGFTTGIQPGGPLLQRRQIVMSPRTGGRSGGRQMLGMEHVDVRVEHAIRDEVLQFVVPNLLIVR